MILLEWTLPAVSDLQNIVNYIARDSEIYAETIAEQIIFACEKLMLFPLGGRIVPEVRHPNVREIFVSPYRILYRVRKNRLQILGVIHGARDMNKIKPKPWRHR